MAGRRSRRDLPERHRGGGGGGGGGLPNHGEQLFPIWGPNMVFRV